MNQFIYNEPDLPALHMPESCLGLNVSVEQIRLSITTFDLRSSSLGDEFACAIQYDI